MSDRDPDRNVTPDAPDVPDAPASPRTPAPPGPPTTPTPPPPAGSHPPAPVPSAVPSKVTTVGVLCLVDGILNLLYGLVLLFWLAIVTVSTLGLGCLLLPIGFYPLVLGVLGIVYGIKLLSNPPRSAGPARWLAVMQILNILLGNVISLVVGVVNLVLFSDPEVIAFFDRNAPRATYERREAVR